MPWMVALQPSTLMICNEVSSWCFHEFADKKHNILPDSCPIGTILTRSHSFYVFVSVGTQVEIGSATTRGERAWGCGRWRCDFFAMLLARMAVGKATYNRSVKAARWLIPLGVGRRWYVPSALHWPNRHTICLGDVIQNTNGWFGGVLQLQIWWSAIDVRGQKVRRELIPFCILARSILKDTLAIWDSNSSSFEFTIAPPKYKKKREEKRVARSRRISDLSFTKVVKSKFLICIWIDE
jgi:hypothetical protein